MLSFILLFSLYMAGCAFAVGIIYDLITDVQGNCRYNKKRALQLYSTCILSWLAVLDLLIFYDEYNNKGFY